MCGLKGQTLDPAHTRGLHAILNGFIDTLRCRNNKRSNKEVGQEQEQEQ